MFSRLPQRVSFRYLNLTRWALIPEITFASRNAGVFMLLTEQVLNSCLDLGSDGLLDLRQDAFNFRQAPLNCLLFFVVVISRIVSTKFPSFSMYLRNLVPQRLERVVSHVVSVSRGAGRQEYEFQFEPNLDLPAYPKYEAVAHTATK